MSEKEYIFDQSAIYFKNLVLVLNATTTTTITNITFSNRVCCYLFYTIIKLITNQINRDLFFLSFLICFIFKLLTCIIIINKNINGMFFIYKLLINSVEKHFVFFFQFIEEEYRFLCFSSF